MERPEIEHGVWKRIRSDNDVVNHFLKLQITMCVVSVTCCVWLVLFRILDIVVDPQYEII